MYKKYGILLLLWNLVLVTSFCCIKIVERNRFAATPAFQMQFMEDMGQAEETSLIGRLKMAASGQRVIGYQVMEREPVYKVSEKDYQILCKIVESEAGGEDMNGRILVANVVLNRVSSASFPNTVEGVVFQKDNGTYQFSPIRDGRYQRVKVSEQTKEAVERALMGEDYSRGALYFVSRKAANPDKMKWFDQNLRLVFVYGGHEFFA